MPLARLLIDASHLALAAMLVAFLFGAARIATGRIVLARTDLDRDLVAFVEVVVPLCLLAAIGALTRWLDIGVGESLQPWLGLLALAILLWFWFGTTPGLQLRAMQRDLPAVRRMGVPLGRPVTMALVAGLLASMPAMILAAGNWPSTPMDWLPWFAFFMLAGHRPIPFLVIAAAGFGLVLGAGGLAGDADAALPGGASAMLVFFLLLALLPVIRRRRPQAGVV